MARSCLDRRRSEPSSDGGGGIKSARRTRLGRVSMDITYRPAKAEDLEEAERVAQQSGNALRVRHGGRPSPAPPPTAFPEFCLAQDSAGLWVKEEGDAIVGFGFSWMTEKLWFLSQLFVRPEAQAKGIGQALLSKTLMQAERNGAANRGLCVQRSRTTPGRSSLRCKTRRCRRRSCSRHRRGRECIAEPRRDASRHSGARYCADEATDTSRARFPHLLDRACRTGL